MINFIFSDVGSGFPLSRPLKSSLFGASAIAGAGSLIGGLFSSHGSRDAARYQLQAARETVPTPDAEPRCKFTTLSEPN